MKIMLTLAFMLGMGISSFNARGDDEPKDKNLHIALNDFLVIPLRLHVLQSKEMPELDCKLSDADLTRIAGKLNGIWNKAGIHWGIESIVHEPVRDIERFQLAMKAGSARPMGPYRLLLPVESRNFDGLHVYYLHEFGVNGVWLGSDFAFVKETAKLRPVEGGIDEPIPRVTAHELGHRLGLPHRQDRTNLLASGTSGTQLNEEEIAISRAKAKEVKGALTTAELREKIDHGKADVDPKMMSLYQKWFKEIETAASK